MWDFFNRKYDVLVASSIIESGLDIPTVNTLLVEDAHEFGLAQLYQLRGRIGRERERAYCYLLTPAREDAALSEEARSRLQALREFTELGSGMRLAMRDLEIRGAGNLLGAEQSGHIAAVGYEMYCRLLERSVAELRREDRVASIDTAVEIGLAGSIPKGYIPSDARRMEAYRRSSSADDPAELDRLEADLTSAYGEPPARVVTLLELARLRVAAARLGVRSMTRRGPDVVFLTERPGDLEPCFGGGRGGDRGAGDQGRGTLRVVGQPDARGLAEVYYRAPASGQDGPAILADLLGRLSPRRPSAQLAQ
jgi:transcription-repair coupling factor (superfamily II helicase)